MTTEEPQSRPPTWTRWWLRAAGIYNLLWGGAVIAFPHWLFDLCGMERMRYPEIWQCVGMIVGVYGIGYWIAAGDSRRHWPIVLVGLLGKLLGPMGFAVALAQGVFPPSFGLNILTNDLIWWVPFALILLDAARASGRPPGSPGVNAASSSWLLLTHVAATLYMVGVIWFVQVVHYPLMANVGPTQSSSYELAHTWLTGWVVGPPMFIELATGLLLLSARPDSVSAWPVLIGLALLAVIWGSTWLVQIPCHQRLSMGFDSATHHHLVTSNWVRTIAWSLRGLLVLGLARAAMR